MRERLLRVLTSDFHTVIEHACTYALGEISTAKTQAEACTAEFGVS